ncbi:MAG: hypothetical protein A2W25_07665 [candidate division Zixibacteria bacterium RBG_16_53_22]|nr:MAG: hypothetical protein A2W25_07665 [candidate division Zixibacteria bacterium RBG_16_53_22]
MISCLIALFTAASNAAPDNILSPDIRLVNVVRGYSDRQMFGNPLGIFYDSAKREVYLADSGNHQIGIFDSRGTTLWVFKHYVTDSRTGERSLGAPHSVVVTNDGEIIISDNQADYLDVVDYRGNSLFRIEPSSYDDIVSFRAAALALDNNGNLYIGTKVDKSEIIKLDPGYEFVMRFGEKGEAEQQFTSISSILVARDGQIFVTDILADPVVKVFSSDGGFIRAFGRREENKTDFSYAAGITMIGEQIWVVDGLRQVVKCLTLDGQFVTMIGGFGVNPGDMNHPSAVASDGDSLLFVAERLGNRFQQFVIK